MLFIRISSSDHPGLPSFPTRRSSDLDKKTAPTLENRYIERAPHMVSLAEIKEAQARLRGIAVRTELLQSDLSQDRSEEHTSELQSLRHLVCRLLLEKTNK